MDQHAGTNPETNPHANPSHGGYPRGRGYGHDYMRGGEVLGGYGYSEREEYRRPRGGGGGGGDAGGMDELDAEEASPRWESRTRNLESPPTSSEAQSSETDGEAKPPVPEIENTFGSTGALRHSRSYYVTQAQLQQRLYVKDR